MKTKTIELPVIPKWLDKEIQNRKSNEQSTSIQELIGFYNLSELYIKQANYVYRHLTDVAVAIKYGYEVEDD